MNANVSHLGQIQGAGALDALWLMVFSGEVLTAFEIAVHLRDKVRTRSIQGAKSAQFPATFRVNTRYHTPGTEITGQNVMANEVTIALDDLVIADTFIAQIEELKNQYDVRAIYATEHGRAQALFYDRVISNVLVQAARDSTPLFPGDGAGTVGVDTTVVSGTADFTASGADLISGVNYAKMVMDKNQVPVEQIPVWALFRPAQWYLIANSDHNINRFYGSDGASMNRQALRTVSDIEIIKSIAPLFGYNVTTYNGSTNTSGIVATSDPPVPGTNVASTVPYGQGLQANYPVKYQANQTNTAGVVWAEPAMGMLQLMGLTMETFWDVRRQGTLMISKQAIGADVLRSKCAVELQHSSAVAP